MGQLRVPMVPRHRHRPVRGMVRDAGGAVNNMDWPTNTYDCILADPPWHYNSRICPAQRTKFGQGAEGHYPLMKDDELLALPVGNITNRNCALFLWATGPRLDFAFDVIKSWGFRYATIGFTWVKTNPKDGGIFFGPGYYTASNSELCLLAVKGQMKPTSNYISQVIIAPRQEHSKKPEEARERIAELFAGKQCIELFCRERRPGWDAFGNEVSEPEPGLF